jgi:Flp pilus assembly protein TadD
MKLNEFEKAQSDFEKCVILDPKTGELWKFLGLAKLNLNKFSEACKDFRTALELGDQNAVQLIKENCKK